MTEERLKQANRNIWVTFTKEGIHKYPNRNVKISVAEDNENGCEVEYNTTKPIQSLVI